MLGLTMNPRDATSSSTQSTDAPTNLIFFDQQLCLRTPAQDAPPAQQIGRALLEPRPEGWPSPWEVIRSPEARLSRTVMGVWRAYAQPDRDSFKPDDEDAWETLEADLKWAAESRFVRDRLSSIAKDLEIPHGEAAVQLVQQALKQEVFALLHLRGFMAARGASGDTARDRHEQYLRMWRPADDATEDLILVYGLYVVSVTPAEGEPPVHVDGPVRALARAGRLKGAAGIRLSWWLTEALSRAAYKSVSKSTPQFEVAAKLRRAQDLHDDGVDSLPLLQVISFLHLVIGAREMESLTTIGSAARRFARAVAYDPMNGEALKGLQETSRIPQQVRQQVEQLRRVGRARLDAGSMVQALEKDVNAALSFHETAEAKKIHEAVARSLRDGLAHRLERLSHEDAEVLNALVEAIDAVAVGKWKAGPAYAAAVRARATALDARTGSLPWERIAPALNRVVLPAGNTLALALASPAPPAVDALAAGIREVGRRWPVAEAVLFRRPALREQAQRWVLSPTDLGFKLMGASGLVILAFLTVFSTLSWVRDFRLDRAYTRAAVAIETGDDARAVRSALTFLKIESAPDEDPRVYQVAAWLEEGMLREVVTLVEAGDTREAQKILDRYEELRPQLNAAGGR